MIILARHGPIAVAWHQRVPGIALAGFAHQVRMSGIVTDSAPEPAVRLQARTAGILVCSDLRRSLDSARAAAPERSPVPNRLFREAELPTDVRTSLALSASTWARLVRGLWLTRICSGGESLAAFRRRCAQAADLLEELANTNASVFLMGHGFLNLQIARELRRRGWRGPRWPSSRHWAATTYRRAG
jgi:broad specificity phosphatase PhoE